MKLPKSESFWKMSRRKERNSMISSIFFSKFRHQKSLPSFGSQCLQNAFPTFCALAKSHHPPHSQVNFLFPSIHPKGRAHFLRTAPTNLKSFIRLLNKFIHRRTLRLPKACAATSINYLAIFLCSDGAG
jgi:hypothetical protein